MVEMLVGIGVLIFVHEFGHFLVAKRLGVKVLRFSMGFGPTLLKFRKGETEYALSLVPFGGYVKMHGEDPRHEETLDERSFLTQSPGRKSLIAVAGPVSNFIFALLFFIIVFSAGISFPKGAVGYVHPDSPADQAGLKEGDKILEMDGHSNPDFDDILMQVALSDPAKGIQVKLERGESVLDKVLHPEYNPGLGVQAVGFEAPLSLKLAEVETDSPASTAGFKAGDHIISIAGREVRGWTEIYQLVNASIGKPLKFVVKRKAKDEAARHLELEVTPAPVYRYDAGIRCGLPPVLLEVVSLTPADRADLRKGDRILSINGMPIDTWSQLSEITSRSVDQPLKLMVDRGGERLPLTVTPRRRPGDWRARVGVIQPEAVVGKVLPGSPAEQAGMASGDKIIGLSWRVETEPIQIRCNSWGMVEELVQQQQDKPITFLVDRDGSQQHFTLCPRSTEEIMCAYAGFISQPQKVLRKYNLAGACVVGFHKARRAAESVYLSLRRMLITHSISARKNLGGPIAVFTLSYRVASLGIVRFLYWLGMLSTWFAVFNLLPVPILDGGHILVAGVEKVKGSPLSERTLTLVQLTGLVLIVSLMVFVTLNDILRFQKYLGG